MKHFCLQCGRSAIDGNLWCQEVDCPLGDTPLLFSYGEPFGDFEIVKIITILRASAVYEATRGNEKTLLKIAHDGCHPRLKREAEFLMQWQRKGDKHPMLPKLLPAHRGTNMAYGKTAIRGRMKYYCVFEYSEGESLRELLLRNPQPWFQHAGWIAISLAEVISLLHQAQRLHLALSPEAIQVRFDKDSVPRIKLLDLGAIVDPQNTGLLWDSHNVPVAYTAPELLAPRPLANASTDVYGIGLILYEMLAGCPAFEFRLRANGTVRHAVLAGQVEDMKRDDLSALPAIARTALSAQPKARPQQVVELAQKLLTGLPAIPREKVGRKIDWRNVAIVLTAIALITLVLTTAVLISDLPNF